MSQQEQKQVEMNIMEDPEMAFGHYAHKFVTTYDKEAEHYRLDFYQESTPLPTAHRINRRLVGRIFLTQKGLETLGKVLGDLNRLIENSGKQLHSGRETNTAK